ncbi:solute carrier family 49 member 4-like isoform X2 [Polyodon spathula]|uniref:solute carrier family 49 member 4-like isoform X2 n=1 Tax=Polyodon spathula TaxID=7913 RepID=UPI001B7E9996|nr:solute carrier family 49 member 4-like isoform X2 [Polyodon spathula]
MGAVWSSTEEEREPLLSTTLQSDSSFVQPVSRVYNRRWLVLGLFSLLGFMQGMVWNTWGPIQNSAKLAYGFTSIDIAMLVLCGPVGFIPWFLFMWLMDKKGLRVTMMLSAFLMVVGTGLRSIPLTDLSIKKWLIHGGQLLNGLAGPTFMSAPPLLSTTWFAPDQRATATAVAALLSYLGAACSFLIGPLVVPAPNQTALLLSSADKSSAHIRDRVQIVLYAEFGMVILLFASVVAYFPSRPPLPPSVAAASQRLSYRSSFYRLLSNFRFLMIALAYSVPLGILAGWSGVLDMILTPAKVSQVDAGWIGFWSTVGGCVVGIGVARFADSMRGMLKLILLLMFSGATLSSTWLTLTCLPDRSSHLPLTAATLYTSCILVGIFIISSVPMFFELFIETVYPVPEGITCGVVTFLSNLFTGALLFFLTFYHTDLSWLNWCLTGSCLFSLLLILLFRESYDRLYLDVFVSV